MDTIVSDTSQENTSLIVSTLTSRYIPTVDEMVMAWLKVKTDKSGSKKTREQYERNMAHFREILHKAGLDLDSQDEALLVTAAEHFAASSEDGREIAGSTYNQRLATLGSFYKYAIKRRWLKTNPMEIVERRKATFNHAAMHLPNEVVVAAFKAIDRTTLQGKRDYALLSVLFSTGRRVSEVCNMKCGDITISGETVMITFPHCKGNEVMRDNLAPNVAKALIEYLQVVYGNELSADAPVWISNSKQNRKKRVPIGIQAVSNVCKRYLNESRVHATRHTFAMTSRDAGADITEIAERLGHKNLATTTTYMKRLRSAENKHAARVAELLGIGED